MASVRASPAVSNHDARTSTGSDNDERNDADRADHDPSPVTSGRPPAASEAYRPARGLPPCGNTQTEGAVNGRPTGQCPGRRPSTKSSSKGGSGNVARQRPVS